MCVICMFVIFWVFYWVCVYDHLLWVKVKSLKATDKK